MHAATWNPQARALAFRLKTQYFLVFAPFAIAVTYQNLHFRRLGFSDREIGTLGAVGAVLSVVSPLLWGYVTDRVRDRRIPLAFLLAASGLAYLPFLMARSYRAALVLQVLFSFFMAPCVALTDALVLEHLPQAGGDYGRIRLWGSLGFIVTLLGVGLFLGGGPLGGAPASGEAGATGLTLTFVAFAVARALSMAWVFRLPRGAQTGPPRETYREGMAGLFRDRAFLLLLGSSFLVQTGLRAYYVFFSIYLDSLGIGDSYKGVFWSIGVVSGTAFMVVAGSLLRRVGVRWTLVLGMAGGALRLLLFSFPLPVAAVGLAQSLHALAFGASHIATVTFIRASVPNRLRATGQTLYAAVTGGLAGAVGSRLAGDLSDALGLALAFRYCALLAAIAAAAAAWLPERRDVEDDA
ncbi:MAG: MFS transporter [Armatimonadota bacterium]|nr:MFS transporter [Armatimonadota bacterium]